MYYLYIHNIVFAVQLQAQCITCTVTKCNFPKMFNCFCILAIFKRLVWSQQRHSIIKIVQIQIWKIKLDEKFHEDNEVVSELPSRTRTHNFLITGSTFWSNFNNIIKPFPERRAIARAHLRTRLKSPRRAIHCTPKQTKTC